MRDPFADIAGHDLVHPHRAEPWQNVFADLVCVPLPGRHFDHMVGKPLLFGISPERLLAAPRVTNTAFGLLDFCRLPGPVGLAALR